MSNTDRLKKEIKKQLAENYPGTNIKWSGNDPTLVLPDALADKAEEITTFAYILFENVGWLVEFHPEKAVQEAG